MHYLLQSEYVIVLRCVAHFVLKFLNCEVIGLTAHKLWFAQYHKCVSKSHEHLDVIMYSPFNDDQLTEVRRIMRDDLGILLKKVKVGPYHEQYFGFYRCGFLQSKQHQLSFVLNIYHGAQIFNLRKRKLGNTDMSLILSEKAQRTCDVAEVIDLSKQSICKQFHVTNFNSFCADVEVAAINTNIMCQ